MLQKHIGALNMKRLQGLGDLPSDTPCRNRKLVATNNSPTKTLTTDLQLQPKRTISEVLLPIAEALQSSYTPLLLCRMAVELAFQRHTSTTGVVICFCHSESPRRI
jgi:hypothetical protein